MGGTIATGVTEHGALPSDGHPDALAALFRTSSTPARVVPFRNTSSRRVSIGDMTALATAIRAHIRDGASGIVVTHGTDTLEETAYGLELLLGTRLPVPIVLTGAMRGPGTAGADGDANALAAVAVAGYHSLSDYGPVVVFADEIHLARRVSKVSSTRVSAFGSPGFGPVGSIVEGIVHLVTGAPSGDHGLAHAEEPRSTATWVDGAVTVEIVWAYAGADGTMLRAAARELDGIVVAGTGGGHCAPLLTAVIKDFVGSGRPAILTSRCADGAVLRSTYGGTGSERDLLASGVIHGRGLAPVKARLRLALTLAHQGDVPTAFGGDL